MKEGFFCPYCKIINACNCENCKKHIKDGEYINTWDESGEILICGKCNKMYSPDQSLEEEFKQRNMKNDKNQE